MILLGYFPIFVLFLVVGILVFRHFRGIMKFIGVLLLVGLLLFLFSVANSMSWGWTALLTLLVSAVFIPIIVKRIRRRTVLH